MWYFILFVMIAIHLFRRYSFRNEARYRRAMITVMEHMFIEQPVPQVAIELASAYMQGHCFQSAQRLFERYLDHFDPHTQNIIRTNIAYCEHPLPWIHGAQDYTLSYTREFFIKCFGGRRMVMITQLATLATDRYLIIEGEI